MQAAFGANDDQAKKAFDAMDTDKSGELSVDEIANYFKSMDKSGKMFRNDSTKLPFSLQYPKYDESMMHNVNGPAMHSQDLPSKAVRAEVLPLSFSNCNHRKKYHN